MQIIAESVILKLTRKGYKNQLANEDYSLLGPRLFIKGTGSVDIYVAYGNVPTSYTDMVLAETAVVAGDYALAAVPSYMYIKPAGVGTREILLIGVESQNV